MRRREFLIVVGQGALLAAIRPVSVNATPQPSASAYVTLMEFARRNIVCMSEPQPDEIQSAEKSLSPIIEAIARQPTNISVDVRSLIAAAIREDLAGAKWTSFENCQLPQTLRALQVFSWSAGRNDAHRA